MRLTTIILVTALSISVVSSNPLPAGEGLQSQALDRLVMVEAENDTALRSKRTIGILRQLFPEISQDVNSEAENQVSEVGGGDHIESAAESQNNEVRVQFADETPKDAADAASGQELAPLEDIEVSDDENRNKRFLNFGLSGATGGGAAAGGGSGAGSGNFLFDIIRQAADGAARAAGTVYRVVAGTQSLGLGLSASRDVGPAPPPAAPAAPSAPPAPGAPPAPAAPAAPATPAPGNATRPALVAGSGGGSSQPADPAAGAPTPGGTEAVPGPITRLFVIANRGISNLIQDLILRMAATSERIVNFKARLITSII